MAEQTPLRAGDPGVHCRHQDEGFCNQHNLHCTAPRCFVRDGDATDQGHVVTAVRRPADIAADLRDLSNLNIPVTTDCRTLADELDALDARWPTADEMHDARQAATMLRSSSQAWVTDIAHNLDAFLDRLDRPAPDDDGDVDPWALLAAVVAPVQSGAEMPERMAAIDAARAALAARDTEERGR